MVYSSRGLDPPGVWVGAVTGVGATALPVRPRSGITCQATAADSTALLKWSAWMETYPLASMKPASPPAGTAGLTTGACTTTLAPPGPLMVIGTWVVPAGALDQSTLSVART